MKTQFPGTLFCFKQPVTQNTLYCAWRLSSRGTNHATPQVGVKGKSPLKLKVFSISKAWKSPFPGTLSGFKQPLTKYSSLCFEAFFQGNKPGNAPGGVRGRSPLKLKTFSKSKIWKTSFPGILSCFKQPPRWSSGKASASRAEDPGFESRLRRDFFGVESYQWLENWHSSGYPARRLAL